MSVEEILAREFMKADGPGGGDVHVDAPLGGSKPADPPNKKKKKKNPIAAFKSLGVALGILKADDESQEEDDANVEDNMTAEDEDVLTGSDKHVSAQANADHHTAMAAMHSTMAEAAGEAGKTTAQADHTDAATAHAGVASHFANASNHYKEGQEPEGDALMARANPQSDKADKASEKLKVSKREFSAADRKKDADSGAAMSDGGFPIKNTQDLKNAIRAIGRAKNPSATKAHIRTRAKALGQEALIPETWGEVKKGAGLYIHRDLAPASAGALRGWAMGAGLPCVRWQDLFVTLMASDTTAAVEIAPETLRIDLTEYNPRLIRLDDGCIALAFDSPDLVDRHNAIVEAGASWEFGDYVPHIILCDPYEWAKPDLDGIDFTSLPAALILDGEEFMPNCDEDNEDEEEDGEQDEAGTREEDGEVANYSKRITTEIKFTKLDDEQRIAYGWAWVSEMNGKQVYDHENHAIDIKEIEAAAHKFTTDVRVGKIMHVGECTTELVSSIVFTKELQAALGIKLNKTGWFVGFRIPDDGSWADVKSGKLPGFSIGGTGTLTQEAA